ncbi:MAG: methionine--tRNA ligase [bacterium]
MNKKDIFYITTPIYYVNDRPHIGHAYTTIAADVTARWHRLKGDDVFFLTGTDEHGAKVAESAAKAGVDPKAFADKNSEAYKEVFHRLQLSYDFFIRTTDSAHARQVGAFLEKLKANGAIYEGEYRGLYCTGCENFITEKELVDGKCPIHKTVPASIAERNYFFKLKEYLSEVERRIQNNEIVIEPETRRQEALGLLKQGLDDFSISREKVAWGIPFPFDKNQTVYVWVEALQNYLTAIGYSDDRKKFEKYWPHVTHLMAKDILKFHAIFWPALLLAAGEEPPKRLFIHGFFTVNGEKMSKSLGNVLEPNALVDQFGSDGARYLLLTQFPFGDDGDVQAGRFIEKYNADLANGLGNCASRILTMLQKFSGGEVPSAVVSAETQERITTARTEIEQSLSSFAFERALQVLWALLAFADGMIDREKPWVLAKEKSEKLPQVLTDVVTILANVALLVAPFLPDAAEKLRAALGLSAQWSYEVVLLPPGRAIAPIAPLFPRLSAPIVGSTGAKPDGEN